jgi:hypothetical protein
MREHGPWMIRSTREAHRNPWVAVTLDEVVRPDGRLNYIDIYLYRR